MPTQPPALGRNASHQTRLLKAHLACAPPAMGHHSFSGQLLQFIPLIALTATQLFCISDLNSPSFSLYPVPFVVTAVPDKEPHLCPPCGLSSDTGSFRHCEVCTQTPRGEYEAPFVHTLTNTLPEVTN